ncbi:MAG TPA: type II toxin-antitoxin system PemK/MazF family toxin [Anaeromyxobacteraceae bacterium]|nr:type II toxin-antitoxin system PemK/MazF family toxin [Anaeromyxobacteraceae bacterium]
MTTTSPERGEVWWVCFDPAVGSEQRKVRPAVVVSRNEIGKLPLRIVVPVTDWKPGYFRYPWFVEIQPSAGNGLTKRSGADAFQVKSVSLERFQNRLGMVGAAEMEDIAAAIALCVGAS